MPRLLLDAQPTTEIFYHGDTEEHRKNLCET